MMIRGTTLGMLLLGVTTVLGAADELVLVDAEAVSRWQAKGPVTLAVAEREGATVLEAVVVSDGDAREDYPGISRPFAEGESRDLSAYSLAGYRVRVTSSDPEVRVKDISLVFNVAGSHRHHYVRHRVPVGQWTELRDDLSAYELGNLASINLTMYETQEIARDTYTWEIADLRLFSQLVYDGAWLGELRPVEPPGAGALALETADGLRLAVAADDPSRQQLSIGGTPLLGGPALPAGLLVRDVAVEGPLTPVGGRVERGGEGILRQQSELPELGLRVEAEYRVEDDGIVISGSVTDTSGNDRAISLFYAANVAAEGLRWWDDVRTVRPVEGTDEYANLMNIKAGAKGQKSRYPLGVVANQQVGLCTARPMDEICIERIAYNAGAQQLFLAFDFGLTPATTKFPSRANFELELFAVDPHWGFRSALERYYAAHPEHFEKRAQHEGIWMAFADIAKVAWPLDFGFMNHEIGASTFLRQRDKANAMIDFDDRAGIYSFRYTTPEPFNMDMPEDAPRTYESAMKVLADGLAGRTKLRIPEVVRAQETCGITNEDGRYWHQFVDYSWVQGVRFAQNTDPEIPEPDGIINRAHWNYSLEEADGTYLPDQMVGNLDEGLDGEYLDSLEWFSGHPNFRRDHFAYSDLPLTFSKGSHRPILMEGFSVAEFLRYIAPDLHRRGKLLMTNGQPAHFPGLAAWIDVAGTECGWYRKGAYVPMPDANLNWRRALYATKPYLLLWNGDFSAVTTDMIESYCKRCLLYALYPSLFTNSWKEEGKWRSQHYFMSPELYERDREHFVRYVPIVRRLSQAGWEPVTGARCEDPSIWIERFGGPGDWDHLVVFNAGSGPKLAEVKVDAGLEGRIPDFGMALDLLSGAMYDLPLPPLAISSEDAVVLAFGWPQGLAAAEVADAAEVGKRLARSLRIASRGGGPLMAQVVPAEALARRLVAMSEELDAGGGRVADLAPLVTAADELIASEAGDEEAQAYAQRTVPLLKEHLGRAMALLAGVRTRWSLGPSAEAGEAAAVTLAVESPAGEDLGVLTGEKPADEQVRGPDQLAMALDGSKQEALTWEVRPPQIEQEPSWTHVQLVLRWQTPWNVEVPLLLRADVRAVQAAALEATDTTDRPQRHFRTYTVTIRAAAWEAPAGTVALTDLPKGFEVEPATARTEPAGADSGEIEFKGYIPDGVAPGIYQLKAVFTPDAGEPASAELQVAYSPSPNIEGVNLALAKLGGRVEVDSSHAGYDATPLNDAVMSAPTAPFVERAWASADTEAEHWVLVTLRRKAEVVAVALHWAYEHQVVNSSRHVLIQVPEGDGWRTVAEVRNEEPTLQNVVKLEGINADKVRVVQPAGEGSVNRPNLMWLSEVEVYANAGAEE